MLLDYFSIVILCIESPKECMTWIKIISESTAGIVYLLDHEFSFREHLYILLFTLQWSCLKHLSIIVGLLVTGFCWIYCFCDPCMSTTWWHLSRMILVNEVVKLFFAEWRDWWSSVRNWFGCSTMWSLWLFLGDFINIYSVDWNIDNCIISKWQCLVFILIYFRRRCLIIQVDYTESFRFGCSRDFNSNMIWLYNRLHFLDLCIAWHDWIIDRDIWLTFQSLRRSNISFNWNCFS